MGVLDAPTHRLLIREIAEKSVEHIDEDHQDVPNTNVNQRTPRRQRTPKLGRKVYGSHDMKRGKGVRQRRRNDNLFFLYQLVESLDLKNIDDETNFDTSMTAFGELLTDPEKMQAWTHFMNMSEEEQKDYLDDAQDLNIAKRREEHDAEKELSEMAESNPNFERVSKKIQDFLRSDQLAKESIQSMEEDFVFSMTESPCAVLVLSIPSSFERLLVYGLCQYMKLQATTHKFKRKCLVEIEAECSPFSPPSILLSDYLKTICE